MPGWTPPRTGFESATWNARSDGERTGLGRLYECGICPDWKRLSQGAIAPSSRLPLYPFDRHSYWLDARRSPSGKHAGAKARAIRRQASMRWTGSVWPHCPTSVHSKGSKLDSDRRRKYALLGTFLRDWLTRDGGRRGWLPRMRWERLTTAL